MNAPSRFPAMNRAMAPAWTDPETMQRLERDLGPRPVAKHFDTGGYLAVVSGPNGPLSNAERMQRAIDTMDAEEAARDWDRRVSVLMKDPVWLTEWMDEICAADHPARAVPAPGFRGCAIEPVPVSTRGFNPIAQGEVL